LTTPAILLQTRKGKRKTMSLVTTMGKYCFIECDGPDCGKKIEHVDPELLKQLGRLCEWKRSDDRWICPDCAEKLGLKVPPTKRRGRSLPRKKKADATA
jgi:hypothetical protein